MNARWTGPAAVVAAAALAAGAAWLARDQLAWAARMAWDGDLESRRRAAAKRDALWQVQVLRARAQDLRTELLEPMLEEATPEKRAGEAFQLRVNGVETRLLEVLFGLDAVRGDADVVAARKDAVRWINAKCMASIDSLRR